MGPYCAEKFKQVFSYVFCTQVRRLVHKQITKRRYKEEKSGRFVFEKPALFTLGLGLTTPDSLGIFVSRHVHTQITKRRYGEQKPGRFVSRKPVHFTLGQGLTMPDCLGILI
nr:hypothetical protein [Phaseolus vulgaris]